MCMLLLFFARSGRRIKWNHTNLSIKSDLDTLQENYIKYLFSTKYKTAIQCKGPGRLQSAALQCSVIL